MALLHGTWSFAHEQALAAQLHMTVWSARDTLAERLRRRPAKPMLSPRIQRFRDRPNSRFDAMIDTAMYVLSLCESLRLCHTEIVRFISGANFVPTTKSVGSTLWPIWSTSRAVRQFFCTCLPGCQFRLDGAYNCS